MFSKIIVIAIIGHYVQMSVGLSYEEAEEEVAKKFNNISVNIDRSFHDNDNNLKKARITVEKLIGYTEAYLQVQKSQLATVVNKAIEQTDTEIQDVIDCINSTITELDKLTLNSLQTCRDSEELRPLEKELINLNKTNQNIEELHRNCLENNPSVPEDLIECADNLINSLFMSTGQFDEEARIFIENWVSVSKNCVQTLGRVFDQEIGAMAEDFKTCIKPYLQV